MLRTHLFAPLAPLALLAPVAAAQTQWTVDDDGPADFASVQAAVAAVAPGDVLLIQPGTYAGTTIDKRLTLLGDPSAERPVIGPLTISGAPRFDLVHLDLSTVTVTNVLGRSRIDDCVLEGSQYPAVLRITDADRLVVQGCEVRGLLASPDGASAVRVAGDSRVAIVDSVLEGGDASSQDATALAGWGGHGVVVEDTSDVTLAGCSVTGGGGDDFTLFFPFDPGLGGDAVQTRDAARCEVRGSSFHELEGGPGNWQGGGLGTDGIALAEDGGTLLWSGVTPVNGIDPGVTWIVPSMPYVYVRGTGVPGASERLFAYGDNGFPLFVATSFAPALLELPDVSGIEVWLQPASLVQLFPLALAGQDTAATHLWQTPNAPELAGLTYIVQGFLDDLVGHLVGTNPTEIVLGF